MKLSLTFLSRLFSFILVLILAGHSHTGNAQSTGRVIYLPIISTQDQEWETVAGNPQRTSWVDTQISTNLRVEWYRPIQAFIPPNFQVIAANNLVYISSARGLYAMRFDTGAITWRFDTELPLGNAPTIATVNGTSMAFVGGYDKKIHAFDALTGRKIWEFTGAQAGFDANPLVINNIVFIGNRDGHFYAISAASGNLLWQYPAANQAGLGAIHLSAAYKNNTLYFATDYNFAYALSTTGTLKWKSEKLVGDGYNSYWPVIYTEPSTHKDYVIFSGKMPYREFMRPGTRSYQNSDTYTMYGGGLSSAFRPITIIDSWATGKTILDYTPSLQYFEQKPYHRTYTILDGATGAEFTMDFDRDTRPEYFPIWPIYNPSTQSPPIIGPDNLIYISNYYEGTRTRVMGWKFGTPYFALSSLNGAHDEPFVLSGSGNKIYRVLCCSRSANYVTLPNLTSDGTLWPYGGNSLANIAPGYDEMIYYLDPTNTHLDNITAIFGNVNGIYGYHGDGNPMVPYKGKLFTIKGNSVIAFGAGAAKGKLSLLTSSAPSQNVPVPSVQDLKLRLEREVKKIVDAGILKPGYMDDSAFGSSYYMLDNYFDNPGDGLYTLSIAYPYLSPDLQSQVKAYLKNSYYPRYFDPVMRFRIGWKDGVQRDSIAMPPEVLEDFKILPDDHKELLDESLSWFYTSYFKTNPNNFYAMWKYAAIVAPEDTQKIYQRAKAVITTGSCEWFDCTKVPPTASDANLIRDPYELNAYIAGYQGFLNLQTLAGQQNVDSQLRSSMSSELTRLINLRVDNFSKNTPFTNVSNGYGRNFVNISRNFIFLTPEIAAQLRQHKLPQVEAALDEYNNIGAYWFVTRFNSSVAESGFQNLYDSPALLAARAWILKEPRQQLYKYLDTPAFERGDLFYIQNLIAVIEAPDS